MMENVAGEFERIDGAHPCSESVVNDAGWCRTLLSQGGHACFGLLMDVCVFRLMDVCVSVQADGCVCVSVQADGCVCECSG